MDLAVSAWQCTCAMLLLACLCSFAWGMQRFFIQPVGSTTGMCITKICGLVFSALHLSLILSEPAMEFAQALLATFLYSASLFLFWWAVYTNRKRPLSAVFSPDLPLHFVCQG